MSRKDSSKIIAMVPARLGSNRVKVKNLRKLNGKPLVHYVIETLKETRYLNQICINSDSHIFAKVAEDLDVDFYERSRELATSASLIDDYIYDFIKNKKPDYLAVVNPTSPFISAGELDRAWLQFAESDVDTQLCCERIQTHCFINGRPVNFNVNSKHPRSQDLEPVLALNFAITIWDCREYIKGYETNGYGVYTGKIGFFETDGFANIDIDYEKDFELAEFVSRFLKSGLTVIPEYTHEVQEMLDKNIDTRN